MTLAPEIAAILPPDTGQSWQELAPMMPDAAYLAGGTALAVRLKHRVSRDLDFFFHQSAVDLEELATKLRATGKFAATRQDEDTLNGIYSETRLQVLHADAGGQSARLLDRPTLVEGLHIAAIPDLLAMKLKVVAQRGELRDYFDLMEIERQTGITVDVGLNYYLARFQPADPQTQVSAIILALGGFSDVDEDEQLPVRKVEIERYWRGRQPEVLKAAGWLSSGGSPPAPPELHTVSLPGGRAADAGQWVRPHKRGGKNIGGYYRG